MEWGEKEFGDILLDNAKLTCLLCGSKRKNGELYRSYWKGDCGTSWDDVQGGVGQQARCFGTHFWETEEELHQVDGWGHCKDGDEPAGFTKSTYNFPYEERRCKENNPDPTSSAP